MNTQERTIELYKDERPDTWEGLIGQQQVARSIQSAIIKNKVPTAYMFSGPRGCGKTSSAFILAKSINCLNPKTDTADPCNECEVCLAIDAGTQIGVTYFSAAQRSGVDDMRELVRDARLSVPINRQVFIIDEIHNLKQGKGFEALLIPLEEKDMPALFILCTTEIEKVPAPILSRVQSRKFSLVNADLMFKYVSYINNKNNLGASEQTIKEAVRIGRGAVRDTLTALEGLLDFDSENTLEEPFGNKLLDALSLRVDNPQESLAQTLKVIAEASLNGVVERDMAEQLFEDLRNLLLLISKVDPEIAGVVPAKDIQKLAKSLLGVQGLPIVLHEIEAGLRNMTLGGDYRINFDASIINVFLKLKRLQTAINSKK